MARTHISKKEAVAIVTSFARQDAGLFRRQQVRMADGWMAQVQCELICNRPEKISAALAEYSKSLEIAFA